MGFGRQSCQSPRLQVTCSIPLQLPHADPWYTQSSCSTRALASLWLLESASSLLADTCSRWWLGNRRRNPRGPDAANMFCIQEACWKLLAKEVVHHRGTRNKDVEKIRRVSVVREHFHGDLDSSPTPAIKFSWI